MVFSRNLDKIHLKSKVFDDDNFNFFTIIATFVEVLPPYHYDIILF